MENFSPIRRGLLEHIEEGKFHPFDLGIYLYLHLRADWSTGICHTCAATIAHQFGDATLEKQIQRSLHRLRDRGYINYPKGTGRRGRYAILIDKFDVRLGAAERGLRNVRLNAWKNGDLARPEYEAVGGEAGGERAERGRIQEVQEVNHTNKSYIDSYFKENQLARASLPLTIACDKCQDTGLRPSQLQPGRVAPCECRQS